MYKFLYEHVLSFLGVECLNQILGIYFFVVWLTFVLETAKLLSKLVESSICCTFFPTFDMVIPLNLN